MTGENPYRAPKAIENDVDVRPRQPNQLALKSCIFLFLVAAVVLAVLTILPLVLSPHIH